MGIGSESLGTHCVSVGVFDMLPTRRAFADVLTISTLVDELDVRPEN